METSFGQGTVCELNENKALAEVYYFIQGSTPCGDGHEFQGFLDPILEYEPLADSLKASAEPVLLLENGERLLLKLGDGSAHVSSALPIFFQAEVYRDLEESC